MARLHDDESPTTSARAGSSRVGNCPPRPRGHPAAALDQLLRDNPGVRPEKLVSAHIQGDNGEGVRGNVAFLELARDPEIVDLVSGVIGDDVDPLGLPCLLQARRRGLRDALAPGRPLLADPPAGDLHGVGGAGALDRRQRLPARDPAALTPAASCTRTCTRTATTSR
jgi:hypothetical protein